jgi:hypothetical protein
MGFLRAQVSIPSDTTVPADACVNVWHFETAGSALSGVGDAGSRLSAFYGAVDAFLGSVVSSPATIKYYDLEDAQPRVPVATGSIVITSAVGNCLPQECAVCLSYQADPVSGQNQARRRGRLFIGPLAETTTATSSGRTLVSGAVQTTLSNAATAMADQSVFLGAFWSVFSPTTAGPEPWTAGSLGSAFNVVTNGWVDNAFDTQRRRGGTATIRQLWT